MFITKGGEYPSIILFRIVMVNLVNRIKCEEDKDVNKID